ncbi:hypothetical protein MNBD_GAMMA25-996 [hydrothermal vent metagenome]|uniref:Lipoprotein n=1 Tax=hydrothermal vent metagenome TaxID=652676 RepID=A0A3B1AWT8_9ZZZZ
MMHRMFTQAMFFAIVTLMLSGCLIGKLSAPDLPQKFNQPSPVSMIEINGLKLGLPKGWKSVAVPKGYKKSGGIIQLEHKKHGSITIYKAPAMADARYGKLFIQTMVEEMMPDYEENGGAYALKSGAIIQIYKGTIKVGSERVKFFYYGSYNISQGMTEYFIHSMQVNKKSKDRAFYDFIAIANSI